MKIKPWLVYYSVGILFGAIQFFLSSLDLLFPGGDVFVVGAGALSCWAIEVYAKNAESQERLRKQMEDLDRETEF